MVTFPELRALMAKYGLDQSQMGQLIGNTYHTFGKKLNNKAEFTYDDMLAIYDFFVEKGEDITMDRLFFAWKFTNVNE